jgi:hypothetical protein
MAGMYYRRIGEAVSHNTASFAIIHEDARSAVYWMVDDQMVAFCLLALIAK